MGDWSIALENAAIGASTKELIKLCQQGKWLGREECGILGAVIADYTKSPQDMSWEEFLASEIAKLGAEQLMLQWFPSHSPEHQAIQRAWQIKYVDIAVPGEAKKANPMTLLLLAGGIAYAMIGAS